MEPTKEVSGVGGSGGPGSGGPGWRVFRLLVTLGVAYLIGVAAGRLSGRIEASSQPAGFWGGVLQGAMMPCMMPALVAGHDPVLYATRNAGRPYKLGYTLGTTGCGAVFFGVMFWRIGRLRARWRSRPRGVIRSG